MRERAHEYAIGMKYQMIFLLCLLSAGFGVAQLPAQVTTPLSCDSVGSNVFEGCYYDNPDLTNLKGTRTDSTINFDWGFGSPDPSIGADHFSVKWEGDFSFSTTGTYRFSATADDGIRLYIDNTVILDKWFDESPTTYTVDRSLTQGTHRIKVEYYENAGGALAQVSWLPAGDSPKGVWGRVTPIADNNHPNLYYNQSEVDELRNMILVQHSPQNLYDLYNRRFKDAFAYPGAVDCCSGYLPYYVDMKAAISYMIEPTSAKADLIRTALLSFMSKFPSGLPEWSTGPPLFAGYAVPWMFDLLMAYNPEKLSSVEITNLKNWFVLSAEVLKYVADRSPGSNVYNGQGILWTEGTKTVQNLPNWFNRYMGPSLACALLSGNQATVDFWSDSGWPHDLFRTETVTATYPSPGTNRFDLVMYLLSVFPSGANTDTYVREGYRPYEHSWYTTDYSWGIYHFAQMYGSILGAEMVYHNGMFAVFGITDVPGTEPALLRTYKRAIESRTEIDRQPANPTGHPTIGWDPAIFAGYRRYSDSTINNAIPGILSYSGPIPSGSGQVDRGFDVPGDVWQFFGYPRRVAWTAGGGPTLPAVTGVTVGPAIVLGGALFSVDFSGSNLNGQTYFDVRFRAPGGTVDQEAWNWQKGTSGVHVLSDDITVGTWTFTGVRAHQEENDHSGSFSPVSAALTVGAF